MLTWYQIISIFYLCYLFQVNKSKGITSSEIDFRKNLVQLRMRRIQREAHELKERRRKEEERRKQEEEERERRKQKAKTKSAFAFGHVPIQLAADEEPDINAEELVGLIDVLDLASDKEVDDVEEKDDDPGGDSQQQRLPDVTTDQGSSVVMSGDKSRQKRTKSSHTHSKNESGSKVKRKGLLKRISKANILIRTLTQMNVAPPADEELTPTASSGVVKMPSTRNFTPDLLKGLLGKTKASEASTDITERRILLEALRRSALNINTPDAAIDPRVEKIRQLVSQSSFGLSRSKGRLGTPGNDNTQKDYLVARLRQIPKQIPPMHQCGPLPFRQRAWERHEPLSVNTEPSEQLWQDVRYCQYVRYTTKFPLVEELVGNK